MKRFADCYVVVRSTQDDDGDAPIECVMAVFPFEEDAKEYIEECYRDDYNEFATSEEDDSYDQYRECPVNYYSYTKKPMLVEIPDSYSRIEIHGGTTVTSETVERD